MSPLTVFRALLQPGCVVGIDMEWRAGFGTVSPQRVALIQLALQEQVFLLDLCAHAISHHSITVDFIRALLSDKSIIKLGRRPQDKLSHRRFEILPIAGVL